MKRNLIIGIAAICTGIGMSIWALLAGFLDAFLIGVDTWCVLIGIFNLFLYFKARSITKSAGATR